MPMQEVMFIDPRCSDHLPLSIIFILEEDKRPKPFRFLKYLAKHKKFDKVVEVAWGRKNTIGAIAGIW